MTLGKAGQITHQSKLALLILILKLATDDWSYVAIVIEPTIGRMKMEGRLARNPLKGTLGDALHAVLCGAGHNIRLMLKKLHVSPVALQN